MKIHIIHDSRRQERYEPLLMQLKDEGITEYELFPCLLLPQIVESINASHKMLVSLAKENGMKEICIAEDDLQFAAKGAWQYFLDNKPTEFKLYTACNYLNREHPITKQIVGFHLYIIHESYYDDFLALPDDRHIDTAVEGIDIHVCYPYAALQRAGFSWNNMGEVDYNTVLQPQDIFSGWKNS
jgi:hypothetical protein